MTISSITPVPYMRRRTDGQTDMAQHFCKYRLRIRQRIVIHTRIILTLRVFMRFAHKRTYADSAKIDWPKPHTTTSKPISVCVSNVSTLYVFMFIINYVDAHPIISFPAVHTVVPTCTDILQLVYSYILTSFFLIHSTA